MVRKLNDYLVIGLKGIAMGAADVVPGVSGGTIAFISGIYEELLSAISNVNIDLLKTLKTAGIKAAWKQLNGSFLGALFLGVFVSIVSLAKVIKHLLESQPILLWSFFFGLVLASIIYIAKQITDWNFKAFLLLITGAGLAYFYHYFKSISFRKFIKFISLFSRCHCNLCNDFTRDIRFFYFSFIGCLSTCTSRC